MLVYIKTPQSRKVTATITIAIEKVVHSKGAALTSKSEENLDEVKAPNASADITDETV